MSAPLRPGERLVGPDYRQKPGESLNIRVDPRGGPNIRTVRPAPAKPGPPLFAMARQQPARAAAAELARQAVAARKSWAAVELKAQGRDQVRAFVRARGWDLGDADFERFRAAENARSAWAVAIRDVSHFTGRT